MARFTGEDGYTLAELLIATAMLGVVVAAVGGVYQVSLQTYTRASSLEDAQLGARAGLDRMATELRLIGAYWTGAGNAGPEITAANATSITFIGDVNADTVNGGVETTLNANANAGATTVTVNGNAQQLAGFNVYAGAGAALNDFVYIANGVTREVSRITGVNGNTINLATALANNYPIGAIVRSVETVTYTRDAVATSLTRSQGGSGNDTTVDNVTGLTLTYLDSNGNVLDLPVNTALIREIRISLTTRGSDGSLRTMTSQVRPRNLPFP